MTNEVRDTDRIDFLQHVALDLEVKIRVVDDYAGKRQFEIVIGREALVPGATLREALDGAMKVIL